MFVVLEGIDGSGKTSVSTSLRDALQSKGFTVFLTREPTELIDPLLSDDGRKWDPLTLFLLFTADRQHHQHLLHKVMSEHDVVICDRYTMSSYAYQGSLISEIKGGWNQAVEWMDQVSAFIDVKADLTVFLEVDPDTAMRRISEKRGKTHSYFERVEYLKSVAEAYSKLFDERTVRIDSTRSLAPVTDDVVNAVMGHINRNSSRS